MPTSSNPYRLHHQLVQQYFGCRRKDYTATKTRNRPGLGITLNQQSYRVETLSERRQICAEELRDLWAAYSVPGEVAMHLLDGQENREGFMDLVTEIVAQSRLRPKKRAPKESFALISALQAGLGIPVWMGMERFDRDLLAAALVAFSRLEGDVAAQRLADLYFANGHVLAASREALVLRYTAPPTEAEGEIELMLYEGD